MPIAKAVPITFCERFFAFLECVACKWAETRFSAPIPLPEIDNNVVAPHTISHGCSPPNIEAYLRLYTFAFTLPVIVERQVEAA